jgi:SAM-dependent methyltransferase
MFSNKFRMSSKYDYSDPNYWEKFYQRKNTVFEWYCEPDEFENEILPRINFIPPVLIVGCGNSVVSEILRKRGIFPVISIDFSQTVIKQMSSRFPGEYLPMDACNLQFRDGIFQTVFDKGTLDAILCGENSKNNSRRKFFFCHNPCCIWCVC